MLDTKIEKQLARAAELPTDEFYTQIAAYRQVPRADWGLEGVATFIAATGAYAIALWPGAIAAGLIGGSYIVWKLLDSHEALTEIESGKFQKHLPPTELEQYRQDVAALPPATETPQLPEAPAPIDPRKVAPPISQQWNERQWQLWTRLIQDCPDLRFALFSKVLVISGPQQTGKSSLASAIAYLRAVLLNQPIIAVTPHIDGSKIFAGDVIGSGEDFEAIQNWYTDLKENFSMDAQRRSLVIDELTQYAGDHEDLGKAIVRSAISESDKHGYAPILINHAKTVSAGFAGIKGCRELIDSSATQITRQYTETDYGAMERSPAIELSRPGQKAIEITLPKWLYMPLLAKHFPLPKPEPTAQDEDPFGMAAFQQAERQAAANVVELRPDKPAIDLSVLPGELKAIAQYAAKRPGQWIKARDCQRNITGFSGHSADTVRGWFYNLAEQQIGIVDDSSDRLRYRI